MTQANQVSNKCLHVANQTMAMPPPYPARSGAKFAESLARLRETFAVVTLARLDTLAGQLDTCADELSAAIRDQVFPVFHDIKGQGASFGFPLLSEIGEAVCTAIRHERHATLEMRLALGMVIDAVRQIILTRDAAAQPDEARVALEVSKEALYRAFRNIERNLLQLEK